VLQLLTFSATPGAGYFVLSDGTNVTAPIGFSASSGDIETALSAALPATIGYSSVSGSMPSFAIDGAAALSVTTNGSGNAQLVTIARTQAGAGGGGFTPQYDWSFASDGTDSIGGNPATLGSLTASGGLQCDGADIATASDAGLSTGSGVPFQLNYNYTPSSADLASNSWHIVWGNYPNPIAFGFSGGQWLATLAGISEFGPYGSPSAGTTYAVQWSYDGTTLTLTVDGTVLGSGSYSFGVSSAGSAGLQFGGLAGSYGQFASGTLSDVEFFSGGGGGTNEQHTITINSDVNGGTFQFNIGTGGPYNIAWNDSGSSMETPILGAGYSSATVTPSGNTWLIDYGVQTNVSLPPVDGSSLTYPSLTYSNLAATPISTTITQLGIGPNAWWLNFNLNNDGSTFYLAVDGTDLGGYFGNSPDTTALIVQSYLQGVDGSFNVVDSTGNPGGIVLPYLIQSGPSHTLTTDNQTGSPGDSVSPATAQDQKSSITIDSSVNGGTWTWAAPFQSYNPTGGPEAWNVAASDLQTDINANSLLSGFAGGSIAVSGSYVIDWSGGSQIYPVGFSVDGSGLTNTTAVTATIHDEFDIVGAGGIAFSGAATVASGTPNIITGGGSLNFSGAAKFGQGIKGSGTITFSGGQSPVGHYATIGSGSIAFSGTAPMHLDPDILGHGTIAFSGSSRVVTHYAMIGAGSLAFSGHGQATNIPNFDVTGSGSIAFSGGTLTVGHYKVVGSGTLSISGNAAFDDKLSIVGAGQIALGGTASTRLTHKITGSGSLVLAGSGSPTLRQHIVGAGSLGFAGVGLVVPFYVIAASGRIVLSGSGAPRLLHHITGNGELDFGGTGATSILQVPGSRFHVFV
jgi:hypothetical protein